MALVLVQWWKLATVWRGHLIAFSVLCYCSVMELRNIHSVSVPVLYYPIGLVGLSQRPRLQQRPIILEHREESLAG